MPTESGMQRSLWRDFAILVVLTLVFSASAHALTSPYQWHTFYGSNDTDFAYSVALDPEGNVYITGFGFATWQGDGGANPLHGHSGERDIVVMKLNSSGAYQWHTFYGGSDADYGNSIAVDGSGNVYIAGSSKSTWQGDGGENPLHSHSGGEDIVVVKLSSRGVYQWHTFYGAGSNSGDGIAVDGSGNVYIAGRSNSTWQGDGGANPLHGHSGGRDVVVVKLNSSGAYQWHTFYGGSGDDEGHGIAVDGHGNAYVTGFSSATWQGDGGINPLHSHSGGADTFALKLNGSGAYQWHTFYGGSGDDEGRGIAVDGNGNAYVTGYSDATWQGDGGENPLHGHSGERDIVVMKLNSSGAYQWHTFYGGSDDDEGNGIAVNGNGNLYVTGDTYTNWQGDGGVNPLHSHSGVYQDIFMLRLNSDGTYQWHTFYGGSGSDIAYGIAVDGIGHAYLSGFSGFWLGDEGATPLHWNPSGSFEMFVLKLFDETGTSVHPGEGSLGTEITISGQGFGTRKGKVLLGKTALKVLEWTDVTIRGSVPKALPPGSYSLTIRPYKADPIILEGAFTVMAPEILSVNPTSGSAGDEIAINGLFFGTKKRKVAIGGKNSKVLTWEMNPSTGESEIVIQVPKGLAPETYDLTVTNQVGSDTLEAGFTIP